jgi:hypothetical protein
MSEWKGRTISYPTLPTAISGLLAWFNASNVVKDVDNNVSQLTDLSGNGNHATASGATQPIYTAPIRAHNFWPSIFFVNATGHHMTLPAGIATGLSGNNIPFSLIAIVRPTVAAAGSIFGLGRGASATPFRRIRLDSGLNSFETRNDAAASTTSATTAEVQVGRNYILSNQYLGTTRIGGINDAYRAAQTHNPGVVTLDKATLGALITAATPSNQFDGYIHEWMLFDSSISNANRNLMVDYLMNKFYNQLI